MLNRVRGSPVYYSFCCSVKNRVAHAVIVGFFMAA